MCIYTSAFLPLPGAHGRGGLGTAEDALCPKQKFWTPLLEPSCYFTSESLGSHVSGRRIKPVNPYLIDVNLAAAIAQRLNQSHSSLVTFGPSFYVSGGHGSFVPRVLPLRLFRALPSPRPVIFFFTLLLRFSLL